MEVSYISSLPIGQRFRGQGQPQQPDCRIDLLNMR